MTSSIVPSPCPPCSSAIAMPGQPSSQISDHRAGSLGWSPSASSRTFSALKRSARKECAVDLISRCSSLKSKSMSLLAQLGKAEHPLGDDVPQDVAGPALNRVGARAQEAVGPQRLALESLGA